jgi:modulator of FtsH protease HflC
MKRNALTVVVGVILLIIFFLLLFTFQVRQTEIAVKTTFDRPADPITAPGLYFKWPPPIQKVYKFDKRIYNFEDEFEENLTRDGYPILANVFVGWTIKNPQAFFNNFPSGEASAATNVLKSSIRSTKQAVIGQHTFGDFISTDPGQMKFAAIEKSILDQVKPVALEKYGIEVRFLGLKRIGLPENVTQKVFERMIAERQAQIDRLKAVGEAEAMNIRSSAERDREQILATARAEATSIKGQAEVEATKAYDVFNQNQDLAIFLFKMRALEQMLRERATLVVDEGISPFDAMRSKPAGEKPKSQNNGTSGQPNLSQSLK